MRRIELVSFICVISLAVRCPAIPSKKGLIMSTKDIKMNAEVQFSCSNGNALSGADFVTCLPSGNWSATIPTCESKYTRFVLRICISSKFREFKIAICTAVQCPELNNLTDANLRIAILNRIVGGQAMFSCIQGYGLHGPIHSTCLQNGTWSLPFPTCSGEFFVYLLTTDHWPRGPSKGVEGQPLVVERCNCSVVEVFCEWSGFLKHGYTLSQRKKYKPGEQVQFNCQPYYILDGQYEVECQENGQWSAPIPLCKSTNEEVWIPIQSLHIECPSSTQLQIFKIRCVKNLMLISGIQACSYPGTVISGRMSSVKFYYTIGEVITFTCEESLVLQGSAVLHCLSNGKWSNTIPACIPPDFLRYNNITHTRN